MSLRIYSTETSEKREFKPLNGNRVDMYVCGPTVYNLLHVGNFRGPIFFNLVRNWMEHLGYEVRYAYNYTDVDDKIIERSKQDGVDCSEISERYIKEFEADYTALGLRPHTYNPKVTEHMPAIIEMIEILIEKDRAYAVNGEVLFSIDSFPKYGRLSNRSVDEMRAGVRIEVAAKKKNPLDFVLWKPSKPGEPKWPSPWGEGRPGWHIECSAMIRALFGDQIDIHGGGLDLTFPHHENEIAQSEGCSDKIFANFWMHNNMVNFGGQKMAKSIGNIVTGRGFLEEYHPEILKFMMLSNHYRSVVDLSEAQVLNSISGLSRIYHAIKFAGEFAKSDVTEANADPEFEKVLKEADEGIHKALCDDFNSPVAFSHLFEVVRAFNSSFKRGQKVKPQMKFRAVKFLAWIESLSKICSLFAEPAEEFLQQMDKIVIEKKKIDAAQVEELIEKRNQARSVKDFAQADQYRDQLVEIGIEIYDTPDGTNWEIKK